MTSMEIVVSVDGSYDYPAGLSVLGNIGECFGNCEVGRGCDVGARLLRKTDVKSHGHG